jgi:taurine dioxygenase
MMAANLSALDLEPMPDGFGAILSDLDCDSLNADTGAALNHALGRHGVLFFRPRPDRVLADEQFLDLAQSLGEVIRYPYRRGENYPDERLGRIDTDREATVRLGTSLWHTDGTPEPCPPRAALLGAVALPTYGGDTMWADMAAAYEGLSSPVRTFLDGLEAVHTTELPARRSGEPKIYGEGAESVHPVIIVDRESGRRMLYVNAHYTTHIVGLSPKESDGLLRILFEHINSPEFHIRWQWQVGDIAIWEERLTQHRVVANFDNGERVLRRAAIRGDRPVGVVAASQPVP